MKDITSKLIVHTPVDATAFLLNEKRNLISDIQKRYDVEIIVIPDALLVTPQYSIERIKKTEPFEESKETLSYQLKSENRIGISFGHISNANIGNKNPGVEIISFSYQKPF